MLVVRRPRDEVATWVQPLPEEFPIRSWLAVTLPRPVPPLAAESCPVQLGVKVWVLPEEVMVKRRLVSEEVAKV